MIFKYFGLVTLKKHKQLAKELRVQTELSKQRKATVVKQRQILADQKKEISSSQPGVNFFGEVCNGVSFIESACNYVRAQLLHNRIEARSVSQSWLDNPETERTGRLCCAIFAHHDGFPKLRHAHFAKVDVSDALKYAPVEFIADVYRTDRSRAAQLTLELANKSVPPRLILDLAGLAAGERDLETAYQITHTEPEEKFLESLDKDAIRFTYLRNALISWREAQQAPEPALPEDTVCFGLIDYKMLDYSRASSNVGDYVQTLALMSNVVRFSGVEFSGEEGLGTYVSQLKERIPESLRIQTPASKKVRLVPINRDFSSSQKWPKPTWMVAYGWYMHPNFKTFFDFPFADNIRPIFISFHVNNRNLLTPEAVEYLHRYQPIGCRDWTTVYMLRDFGIKAFFSGCMTTTIGKLFPTLDDNNQRLKKVALVEYKTSDGEFSDKDVQLFKHADANVRGLGFVENLMVADQMLNAYRDFGHIATSRLHCYLPCASMGLDVTFKPRSMSDVRFEGLSGHDKSSIKNMAAGIETKLANVLQLIFAGESEETVYRRWSEICAADLSYADDYCRTLPPFPAPGFNVSEVVESLRRDSWIDIGPVASARTTVQVAFAVDQNLWDDLYVVIESLLSHTPSQINFHVMTRGVSRTQWAELRKAFAEAGFAFYRFDNVNYGDQLKMLSHTTVSTMDRLLLPDLLEHLDRVIYLDVDILVLGNVMELWRTELGNKKLAGKSSNFDSWKYGYNLVYRAAGALPSEKATELRRRMHAGGSLSFNAFNAGVLVMNLKQMRQDDFANQHIPLIEHFCMNDQDALNMYARGDKVELGVEWNTVPSQDHVEGAKIVHFAGQVKPWDSRYTLVKPDYLRFKSQLKGRLGHQQRSKVTFPKRHTNIIQEISSRLAAQGRSPKKILSFGCSEGYECLDIKDTFPDSSVYGCDINHEALKQAKTIVGDSCTIFGSTDTELTKHGPFDLITVFNVLCRYPESVGMDNVSTVYPFSEYEALISVIDRHLAPGGALAIYNSNYFFEDTAAAANYTCVELDYNENGWIEKCSKDGTRLFDVTFTLDGKDYARDEFRALLKASKQQERPLTESRRSAHQTLRQGMSTLHSTETILWVKRS